MGSMRSRSFQNERWFWSVAIAALLIGSLVVSASLWAGTLEIRIKDHREAIGDFSKLDITIEKIRLRKKSMLPWLRATWKELQPTVRSVDLTRYSDGSSAGVFRGKVAPGKFDAIDLKIKNVSGALKKNKTTVEPKNAFGAIQLAFAVMKSGVTRIILDLEVLDLSDHPPLGYVMQMKGYELYLDGKLIDRVPPA